LTTGAVIIRDVNDIQPTTDVCGEIRALSSKEDFPGANVAQAIMRAPTEPHYHPVATEFYYAEKGRGRLVIGSKGYEIKNRMLIIIPSNTAHYTIPRSVMRILVFSVPAWSAEDQIVPIEGQASYSTSREKLELIDALLIREGLEFEKKMIQEERKILEGERQNLIQQNGWKSMPIPELRELLQIP